MQVLPFMRFGPIHEVQKNDASYDANSDAPSLRLAELRHLMRKLGDISAPTTTTRRPIFIEAAGCGGLGTEFLTWVVHVVMGRLPLRFYFLIYPLATV